MLPYYISNRNPLKVSNNGLPTESGNCVARTAVALALAEYYTDKKALAQLFYLTSVYSWKEDKFTHARAITEGDQQGTTFIMDSDRSGFMGRAWSKTSSGPIELSGARRSPHFLRRGQRYYTLPPAEFCTKYIGLPWNHVARYVIDAANDIL
jgi:hypothetical protein